MNTEAPIHSDTFAAMMQKVAHDLSEVRFVSDVAYMSLPLIYPDGSFVTISIRKGFSSFAISDNGFAYRELEAIGKERSFSKSAQKLAETHALSIGKRTITASAEEHDLVRAICDVAGVSYRIVSAVYEDSEEADEATIEEDVQARLVGIFPEALELSGDIVGASTARWNVTALLHRGQTLTVFQAVSKYAQSVYRTNALFDDLLALETPPNVVSIVRNRHEFGPTLNILNRVGLILEVDSPDSRYLKAAEAA